MRTQVQRHGDALLLPIPPALAHLLSLAEGAEVEVRLDRSGRLVVESGADLLAELLGVSPAVGPVGAAPSGASEPW